MYIQNNNSADITLKGMYYRSVRGSNLPPPRIWPLAGLAEGYMTAEISHSSHHNIKNNENKIMWKINL